MGRSDLERLSKEELIELVLRLQRPQKTSCTSSKPPATDRKQQRERSRPGGAKPGHEGHSRILSATPDEVVEHRPDRCSCCSAVLMADLPGVTISQGGLMTMLRRAQGTFAAERDRAITALRQAWVVASDETGVRIEGSN